jgi:hypothetical protein
MKATLMLIAFVSCAAAQEITPNTVADEFRAFTEETAAQCKAVKDQLAQFKVKSDPLTGYTLRDAVQSLCVCMPGKAEAVRGTFTADELAGVASQENFVARFKPAVIDACAAEQLRSMYGEECPKRFKTSGVRAPTYCACMQELVSGYSDATAAEIAAAAADYLPEAAAAEQDGRTAPPRPPVLESYWQADQACKARKKR